jgi:hypothetical protein
VPRRCVILTGVPNSEIDSEKLAEIIGLDLQLNVVVPQLDNLQTIDTSHLNAESGERWATAFLRNAAGLITACLPPK